jgi:hypothetical protein
VAVPLAVEVELKEPQAPALPQVTDQVTPPFLLSLLTMAVRLLVAPLMSDVGGAGLKDTVSAGVVMVMVAVAVLVVSVTEVAVTVTVLPAGIAAGAV